MTASETVIFLAQGSQGSPFGMLLFVVPMLVIMYLVMIKPQQKKQKEHQEMQKKLQVGDQIITSGGIFGRIAAVEDNTFTVEIAKNTKVKITRGSVAIRVKDNEGESDK